MMSTLDGTIKERWTYFPKLINLIWSQMRLKEKIVFVLITLASGIFPVLALILLQQVIDTFIHVIAGEVSLDKAIYGTLAVAVVIWLSSLLEAVHQWQSTVIRELIKIRLQEQLLLRAASFPYSDFESPDTYDRLSMAQRGLDNSLRTFEELFTLVLQLNMAAGLLIYVGSIHYGFPILLLAGSVFVQLVQGRLNKAKYILDKKHTQTQRKLNYLNVLITGKEDAAEIRLFGLQSYFLNKRMSAFMQLRSERLDLEKTALKSRIWPGVGEQCTFLLVIVGVVLLIARGSLTVGYYASFLGAAERFRDSANTLLRSLVQIDGDLRYFRNVIDVLEQRSEHASGEKKVFLPTEPLRIQLHSVSFTYSGSDEAVLRHVSLCIEPGESVALIGRNGAGKTTLIKLILGLYKPTEGFITVNGVDLNDICPVWWHSRTAAILQEFVQYEGSVAENIAYGHLAKEQDLESIHLAAEFSGASEFIEALPEKYTTQLGKQFDEAGTDLSIGQWQKLALARAYLCNAPLLILDEPASALDAGAEADMYRRFQQMSIGKSVVWISHHLASTQIADRIVVLDQGRIVEEGSHAELIGCRGMYAEMYAIQSYLYEAK
ncbi:ABC transporter ATP-binding protein [Paenibacillus sp. RC67]|uniref:ABC transporter ATP-binding protein n=1 Tax=Paenibacillus sp. RC67 TaxID=3039392 RepID=UPI0024AE518C|nr:ABC transporter ATP-binding protein [Paenibacillus sp. RC67]